MGGNLEAGPKTILFFRLASLKPSLFLSLNNTPHSSVHQRKWKVPTLPWDCRSLTIRSNTLSCYCAHMHCPLDCCKCNTQCTYRVYIKYTGLGEEHARRQWMGSLKIALTQKIMQPRIKIWRLVFEFLKCVKCLLQYNKAHQGTKELWLRLFVCVHYTHMAFAMQRTWLPMYISPHYIKDRVIFSHFRQVQVQAMKSSLPSCCD